MRSSGLAATARGVANPMAMDPPLALTPGRGTRRSWTGRRTKESGKGGEGKSEPRRAWGVAWAARAEARPNPVRVVSARGCPCGVLSAAHAFRSAAWMESVGVSRMCAVLSEGERITSVSSPEGARRGSDDVDDEVRLRIW